MEQEKTYTQEELAKNSKKKNIKIMIEKINNTSIADFANSKKLDWGHGRLVRCLFHEDKTPSFSVSPKGNVFNCFGCGRRGKFFNFYKEYKRVFEKRDLSVGEVIREYRQEFPDVDIPNIRNQDKSIVMIDIKMPPKAKPERSQTKTMIDIAIKNGDFEKLAGFVQEKGLNGGVREYYLYNRLGNTMGEKVTEDLMEDVLDILTESDYVSDVVDEAIEENII